MEGLGDLPHIALDLSLRFAFQRNSVAQFDALPMVRARPALAFPRDGAISPHIPAKYHGTFQGLAMAIPCVWVLKNAEKACPLVVTTFDAPNRPRETLRRSVKRQIVRLNRKLR